MLKQPASPEENKTEGEGKASVYGGYFARHEYEKKKDGKTNVLRIFQALALVVLAALSCLGVLALVRGDFLPEKEESGSSAGSIKVPTQSQISESVRAPEEMLADVSLSLVTLEAELADGSFRYGTGVLVSDDGYAVCAASLLADAEVKNLTATASDGFSFSVERKGVDEKLGIALLQLQGAYSYVPIPVENSFFVERGEELYAVAACKPKVFYGTVAKGLVASVGPSVKAGKEQLQAGIVYLDIAANRTLYGAVAVDESGAAVGIVTDAIKPLYGNLTPVIPINIVYAVINDLLVQG